MLKIAPMTRRNNNTSIRIVDYNSEVWHLSRSHVRPGAAVVDGLEPFPDAIDATFRDAMVKPWYLLSIWCGCTLNFGPPSAKV
jgi:hypothetical protein